MGISALLYLRTNDDPDINKYPGIESDDMKCDMRHERPVMRLNKSFAAREEAGTTMRAIPQPPPFPSVRQTARPHSLIQ
jgi:hypothetical protein